jgi:hypothetical protein
MQTHVGRRAALLVIAANGKKGYHRCCIYENESNFRFTSLRTRLKVTKNENIKINVFFIHFNMNEQASFFRFDASTEKRWQWNRKENKTPTLKFLPAVIFVLLPLLLLYVPC